MKDRRNFLKTMPAMAAAGALPAVARAVDDEELRAVADAPVLNLDLKEPVIIQSIELLKRDREYLVRIRSKDGVESVTVPNSGRVVLAWPIFVQRIIPFFRGKDARDLEALIAEFYRSGSNYKYQGLALWVCLAAVEMGILDLLGRISGRTMGDLLGGVKRTRIPVYRASGNRENTPEEEVTFLRRVLAETGASAVKIRVGGRMKRSDSQAGRTKKLIPLVREELGPDITIYADSNSSWEPAEAIRYGRMMEEHDYAFLEEPCPFDHLWETKEVADALTMPVAGGEQEFSERRFRWAIENRVMDVAQPDLHYYGGYIRSIRVARMAHLAGMPCTAHMSGWGLGFMNMLHFASCIDDPGAHQEFKGLSPIPLEIEGSDLLCHDGIIDVPTGPGFGVTVDPDWVQGAELVRA